MPDSRRFLHPDAIRRLSRLELRARHIVEGFLSGMHRSPYFGQSVEFAQHREYVHGDDLRHVDWKVWARQDRLYVKQYEEDTNLRCTLLVDSSASMRYGNGPLNKYEYACTTAASLAYLILKQNDAVGCMAFDERIRLRTPIRSRNNHIFSIVESLNITDPADKSDMYAVFRSVAEGIPRRGMVIVCTRHGFLDSILDEKSCYFVEKNDPASIAAALEAIDGDRVEARRKAHNARQRLLERFTTGRCIPQLEALYRRLLA